MAVLTIRNLDENTKKALRLQAAENDRSMEEEARVILRLGVANRSKPEVGLGTALRRLFEPFGGVDLPIPPRSKSYEPPDLE